MNPSDHPLAAALQGADLIHDSATLDAAISRMAAEIDRSLDASGAVLLTIMQGGLPFAGQLATRIATPLLFDYVHATRYRGETSGGELHWIRRPKVALTGRTVLLVDDILDEGHTLDAVRAWCLDEGAARVLIAVLCRKPHGRGVSIAADFVGVEVPDRYVFGYGMDYYEQGRNLPAIYALGQ
ncbi:MAG: hypoxanthine-guanine phosphoribosyltransferase [Dokdonella sp.]|uniref:hypoxanthine-guanine phosphoribosyltransferase n=1 Tax=Dokdonella sp. TaxID=2291710 RepID=UPI0025B8FFDB|nr:hypoxanthine-guanine phosphoribosyltransferase [Dokdonella sp.]MBX3699977.1 hypoxanthine-guanine phosphoribosyltransferase [Dokdonella sp.]MCW5578397.1 hypoxanthine-guanine phosphoribosyltransferase [Dokdonella sp.]